MNDLLARSGYYVSGHSTFAYQLHLPDGTIATVRHARLYSSAYPDVFLLVLECPFDPSSGVLNFSTVRASTAYQELASLFGRLPILAFQQQRAGYFMLDEGIGPQVIDDAGLQRWFENVDAAFTREVGTAKSVNRSVNDLFVPWTGANLARACVFNDIDAIMPPKDGLSGVLVELKRPNSALSSWGPYAADTRNYESSAAIASRHGLENRTIAHNMNRTPQVGLFLDVRPDQKGRLASLRAMVDPSEAIAVPLPASVAQKLRPHVSRR